MLTGLARCPTIFIIPTGWLGSCADTFRHTAKSYSSAYRIHVLHLRPGQGERFGRGYAG